MSEVAQVRKQRSFSEIAFEHIETDEELPQGTQEMVEEILAESLFQLWLAETRKGHRKEDNESSSIHT